MYKFIDLVEIEIEGGHGGDGKIAWRREKYEPMGGPAGGDGGQGGSVYFEATNNLNTLLEFHFNHKFKAEDGNKGESSRRSGSSGKDLIIKVPVGTVIKVITEEEEKVIGDLCFHGERILLAKGGRGGRGNQHFATSVKQAPHFCEPGLPGRKLRLRLELKLVAHIGIIGMPNAGKSTLISRLSACKPKIADYPFTTLTPNLGILRYGEDKSFVIADIPGLIEGASQGVGLGLQFLRHVERSKMLLHLIDGASQSAEDCLKAYKTIIKEIGTFNPDILKKKHILMINKVDACSDEQVQELQDIFKNEVKDELFFISAVSGHGLDELKKRILEIDKEINLAEIEPFETVDIESLNERLRKFDDFEISFDEEQRLFKISSPAVEGLVRVTNFSDYESVNHLFQKLKKINLLDELKNCGIKTGDTVLVGTREMVWSEFADDKLV